MVDFPDRDPDADASTTAEAKRLDQSTPDYVAQAAEQRIILRWVVMIAVAFVVLVFGYLEWCILRHILSSKTKVPDLFVFLAISPMVCTTIIVVFVLIGVFRGFRESDMTNLPVETALKGVAGND